MGTKAKEIIGVDVKKVVQLLNKAYADEWLAYYQYWVGAKLAQGPTHSAVIAELEEHATDELRHAQMLTTRIIQLGSTPILEPKDWYTMSNCGYATPNDPHVKKLLQQNIEGEQCAINVYNQILHEVKDKDLGTYNMALEILEDEIEHKDDLEALLKDINLIK